MSDEDTIHVRIRPELTPVRTENRINLNAAIDVAVKSRLTGLGIVGVIALAAGVFALLAGALVFMDAYPEKWYAQTVPWAESRAIIELVVLLFGGGIVALFLGTSMFFYGRTVLGSGELDQFQMQENVEGHA